MQLNLRCIIDMAKSACFCFTLNNYTDEDVGRLCCLPPPYCCLFGKEVAPTTGTKHLQGMLWHEDGDVYSNCYDAAVLRRLVSAAAALSKCNYWLGAALQHIDSPDDFLSDPKPTFTHMFTALAAQTLIYNL